MAIIQGLLGKGSTWWICQAVPVGGVSQQIGHDVTNQSERDLLQVQAEDAVEELDDTERPLLTRLLHELLEDESFAVKKKCLRLWL